MTSPNAPIYQIKITLAGSKPPIWRRVLVSAETTLDELHRIIQTAMGWEDYHLHAFDIDGERYAAPVPDDASLLAELGIKSSLRAKLSALVDGAGKRFKYEYDFGDGWLHNIVVEQVRPADPEQSLPVCIAGRRACPPEDAGGVSGYAKLLKAIADPEHDDHVFYTDWVGGMFDPDALDLEAVNRRLAGL